MNRKKFIRQTILICLPIVLGAFAVLQDFDASNFVYWKIVSIQEPGNIKAHWFLSASLAEMGFTKQSQREMALYESLRAERKNSVSEHGPARK